MQRSRQDSVRAIGFATAATRERSQKGSPSSGRVSAIASGTVIRPVFTSRIHYGAPKARGHRSFILAKQEWR